jgi:hypothetical protein
MKLAELKVTIRRDRKKVVVLGLLLVVMGGALYYSTRSSPPRPAAAKKAADPNRVKASDLAKAKAEGEKERFGPIEVLDLSVLQGPQPEVTVVRNVFAYPPPPVVVTKPAPAPPPPPEPTINLASVTPSTVVAGTPRDFDITATGNGFPADARIVWNGRQLATTVVSPTQLQARITAAEYANAGMVKIEVVSASNPKHFWSRAVQLNVSRSPDPGDSFVFLGRIGNRAVVQPKTPNSRQQIVEVGQTFGTTVQWRVLAVEADRLDLLDVRNEIRKTMHLQQRKA